MNIFGKLLNKLVFEPANRRLPPEPTPEELSREFIDNIDHTKRANKFEPCAACGWMTYQPKGRSEIIIRHGHYYVRQTFDCARCGVRSRLGRRMDSEWWTRGNPATMPFMVDYL